MKYTIKQGQKDWKPMEFPCLYSPKVGSQWIFDIEFTESCYYNWLPDMDQHDYNKIGGVTNALSLNNVDSALIGWRSSLMAENLFEIVPYFNVGSAFEIGNPLITGPGVTNRVIITYKGNKTFETQIESMEPMERKLNKFWFGRRIGMNMGGANNAPGPYGGVASQDMEMYVTYWYVR